MRPGGPPVKLESRAAEQRHTKKYRWHANGIFEVFGAFTRLWLLFVPSA